MNSEPSRMSQERRLEEALKALLRKKNADRISVTEIAEEAGITVDRAGFDEEMRKQKERARNARGNVQSMASQSKDLMDFDTPSVFVGYETTECEATVIGLFQNGAAVDELTGEGEIVFDKTPF